LIATQHLFKGFSVFFFLPWLEKRKIDIELTLKKLMWFIWVFAGFVAVVSYLNWTYTFTSPLSGNELAVTGAKYDKSIIFFGAIYYLVRYFNKGNFRYLIYTVLLFSSTQIYDIQRGDFVFMGFIGLVVLLYYRKSMGTKKLIILSPVIMIIIAIGIGTSDLTQFNTKFQQLFLLAEGKDANQIQDASVFIRIQETDFALNGFYTHPVTGNGLMRASAKESLIGNIYFYPADVGIIGILYTFGSLGLGLLILILIHLIKLFRLKSSLLSSVFLIYTVFIFVSSMKDGSILFFPLQAVLSFTLIHVLYYNFSQKNEQTKFIYSRSA
jgi:hypothetical protein